MNNYWTRYTTRRRIVRGGAAFAGAAATLALVGCGGDDAPAGESPTGGSPSTGGSSSTGGNGLLAPPQDRSAEAVRGGILNSHAGSTNPPDPISGGTGASREQTSALYNLLLQAKPGVLEPSQGEVVGDAAASWEMGEDRLELTVRLKPNLGTDPRPPLNGRNLDAQDVLATWDRFAAESNVRSALVNSVNPDAPIESVTSPDMQTVIFKFAYPSVLNLAGLANGRYLWIMPRGVGTEFDPRIEAHGAGPFYLDSFQEDANFQLRRNPNYYDSNLPYLDGIDVPVVPESSAALAQLEAKSIDISSTVFGGAGVTNENVLSIRNRHSEMTLFELQSDEGGYHFRLGFADGSPFKDQRVRVALSKSVNREEIAEFFTSASLLAAQGLPMEPVWVSHIPPMFPEGLDTRDDAFGTSKVNFEYDAAEAMKLLAAAGFENTPIDVMYSSSAARQRAGQAGADQLRKAGWNVNERPLDPTSEYVPILGRSRGDYQGVGSHPMFSAFNATDFLMSNFGNAETSAVLNTADFPELTSLLEAMTLEFDDAKREALAQEWALQAANDMPTVPHGAVGSSYQLAWPWVANVGVFQRWIASAANNHTVYMHYWYDQSKDTR